MGCVGWVEGSIYLRIRLNGFPDDACEESVITFVLGTNCLILTLARE